jgi:SAM-dependent methyltransferase
MTNEEYMSQQLAPYEPQCDLAQLIIEVNRLYHSFEAPAYDAIHPELSVLWPQLWQDMVQHVVAVGSPRCWRILDFGCGTGFEASQLLRLLPRESIARLTCYDPSPEMMEHCRVKVAPLYPEATFCTNLDDVPREEPYNLLATNSLLHHLPDAVGEMRDLLGMLSEDAVWLAGHEPSRRFYDNPECVRVRQDHWRQRRWRRFLHFDNYVAKFKEWTFGVNPRRQTAEAAHRRGLFRRRPPLGLIGQLVDFWVPNSPEDAACGRGLDFETLQRDLAGAWELSWVKTYGFIGVPHRGRLPKNWARAAERLSELYPKDGTHFGAVWRRA